MKKSLISILAALGCTCASGQVSHALYYMESVPQTNLLNPARQPRANIYIAIPGTNLYVAESTNLRTLDFVQKKDGEWVTPISSKFDYSKLYDAYKNKLALDAQASLNLINFGWRTSRGNYFAFAVTERVSADVALPSDFLKIGDKGLTKGTLLDLSTLGVDAKAYTEVAATYAFSPSERLDIGVRLKYLSGIAAVKTKNKDLSIQIGEDEWHVKTDVEFLTSMPLETDGCLKDDGTIDFDSDSIQFRDFDETRDVVKYITPNFKNPGFGADLGAVFTLNDNFRFSASVTDLGFISYHRDVNRFKSKGEFDFNGIEYDMGDDDQYDDFQNAIDDAVDSILTDCNATLAHGRFVSGLRPSVFIGAEFTPVYFLNIGFLSHSKFYASHRVNQDFNISATLNPFKFPMSATFGYTINTRGLRSGSFGFSIRAGVVQFYTMLDYIPAKYNNYTIDGDDYPIPHNISNFNVSLGMNLIFGTKGYKDKPMIRSNSSMAK